MNAEEIADAVMGPPSGREAEAAPERIEGERAARPRLDNDGPITEKYSVRAALGIFLQPGDGLRLRCGRIYLATVLADTLNPNLANSAWIRF